MSDRKFQAPPSNGLVTRFLQNIKEATMARDRLFRVVALKRSYEQRSYFAQAINT